MTKLHAMKQHRNREKDIIKDFIKWEKENCSPKCSNPSCHRPDRGGMCGLCGDFVDKRGANY